MRKQISRLFWLMALPIVLGMASCTDKIDNPVTPGDVTVVEPEQENITEDQLSVKVTEDLPTAVLGTLDEGSTGAALVRRLPKVTSEIIPGETQMVLLPASKFDSDGGLTADELDAIVRLSLNGGYMALERPTRQQMLNFALLYVAKLIQMQELQYQEMFDIDEAAAARAARSSQMLQRTRERFARIEQVARTRAEGDGADDAVSEMVIFGPTDYFMQQPFEDETTTLASETDSEGNETEPTAETAEQERTDAISGELADAAAEWLNDVSAGRHRARAITRASGSSAVNEIMDASETFTFNGNVYFPGWDSKTWWRGGRLSIKVSSWGVHDMETNKDYYYLKENVLISLGKKSGRYDVYYPCKENYWYDASGYGEYNHWFGAFLSQYKTSMTLTGSGSIALEASSPATDNSSQSTSITIGTGSSSSTTTTLGMTWGANLGIGASGPSAGVNYGGSYSKGHTTGTSSSFSMGMSQSAKDLKVTRNTDGKKVTWTYDCTLPQYYFNSSTRYHCHQQPAAILVNDAEMTNEICWSVSNPSGRYTVEVTSAPKLAALLYSRTSGSAENRPHKYVDRSDNQTYPHTLLEPFRKMQTWRTTVENVEYVGEQHYGSLTDLEKAIQNDFADIYEPTFQVADYDADALNTISSVIAYRKSIFEQKASRLEALAQQYGIKKFEITWTRDVTPDNKNKVASRDGFTLYVCPKATEATQEHVGWVYGSDGCLYPSADYAKGHDASAVGIVAYVNDGSDFGNKATEKASGAGHGLALAMKQTDTSKYWTFRISKGSGTFTNTIGNSLDNAKNDFDGLAKTKALIEKGTNAANVVNNMGAAPTGGTDWFIPSTGQWIAMLCKPGLGGAEIPTGTGLNTPFNINGCAKLSSTATANGGKAIAATAWTSSGFNSSTGIYLVNSSNPRFSWYNSSQDSYIRAAFAF